jgi:Na+-driven multidrug efflux pump
VHQIIWTALNVLGRPYDSLALELILAFGLWIPFGFIGAQVAGVEGVFVGLSVGSVGAGVIAYVWARRVVKREKAAMASE